MSFHYCSLCTHTWHDPEPPPVERRGLLRPCPTCLAERSAPVGHLAVAAARIAAAALVAVLVLPAAAFGHPTPAFLQRHTTIRVHSEYVLGHKVRVCSWRPGDARVRGRVRYSRSTRTVEGWAGAGRKRSRAACAMNGGTYRVAGFRPSGTLIAGGHLITRLSDAPAVGFLAAGRVVFGARAARARGAANIMNGLAFLVDHGRALSRHSQAAWTTRAQYACGARGTDSWYGCSRSVVAAFSNGRVGLVEVSLASMPLAARIMVRMGVVEAVTFDSGGAARLWTVLGSHNVRRGQVGHSFGTIPPGYPWHRLIPDAIVINARAA